ncbi:hypothetical protein BX281_0608 [Streptomyces sp. Ag82_O1-15]|uniref:hypothetical protein n=1 Tax=Streptomyces sp. Ag82_O1-15 TaxID=1938855 RepID=UPI000BB1633C|nr:hypothetical protein [Streptomyces sp. Ag82_O1-15]PBC92886.1 hypothetical protein BX281_0608 [Streptomyces sp. Ag82_O1-15]
MNSSQGRLTRTSLPTAHRLRGAALGVIGALVPESGNALPPGRIQYTSEAPHYVIRLSMGRDRSAMCSGGPIMAMTGRVLSR